MTESTTIAYLSSLDPRSGASTGQVPTSTPEVVAQCCSVAGAAFEKEQQRRTFDDGRLLTALADVLESNTDVVVGLVDEETGLGADRLGGEFARTAFQLRAFSKLAEGSELLEPIIDTADPDRVPPRADQRRMNIPLGPVAVFAASNFPLAFGLLGGDTASALAAGCPVVAKAHPAQPRTGELFARLVPDALGAAGAPPGWFQVVAGEGPDVGLALVQHPAVRAVGFTGSLVAGTALVRAGSERPEPIPVYAEMGSLNPVLVGPVAARTRAVEIAEQWTATLTASAGQLCTKPGLLVLPDTQSAETVARVVAEHGAGAASVPMLAPRLRESLLAGLHTASSTPGVAWVQEPVVDEREGVWQSTAVLTVDAETVLAQPHLLEELFGPAGIIVVATSDEQVIELARVLPGSLTTTLHSDPDDSAWAAMLLPVLRHRSGRVVANGWPTGVSVGWATVHGGPWPASSAAHSTSVGLTAARRFLRPVAYQGLADALLPPMLQDANPLAVPRLVDGHSSARGLPGVNEQG